MDTELYEPLLRFDGTVDDGLEVLDREKIFLQEHLHQSFDEHEGRFGIGEVLGRRVRS